MLASETAERQTGADELLETFGYTPVRWAFDMVKDPIGELDPSPLPAGLEVRRLDPRHSRAAWDARNEALLDLSGGVDTSDAAYRGWVSDPALDRSLLLVAWDGSEIAGGVFNALHPDERSPDAMRGWLDSVFTRRPWRGRGLASGLIARSLRLLADRGAASAALGVEADNPSGALRLYTKAGFSVADRYTEWRKPMQDPDT